MLHEDFSSSLHESQNLFPFTRARSFSESMDFWTRLLARVRFFFVFGERVYRG